MARPNFPRPRAAAKPEDARWAECVGCGAPIVVWRFLMTSDPTRCQKCRDAREHLRLAVPPGALSFVDAKGS